MIFLFQYLLNGFVRISYVYADPQLVAECHKFE